MEAENAWHRVELAYDWVRDHVEYTEGELTNASMALKNGKGDCEEMTSLFVAILSQPRHSRANGLDSRPLLPRILSRRRGMVTVRGTHARLPALGNSDGWMRHAPCCKRATVFACPKRRVRCATCRSFSNAIAKAKPTRTQTLFASASTFKRYGNNFSEIGLPSTGWSAISTGFRIDATCCSIRLSSARSSAGETSFGGLMQTTIVSFAVATSSDHSMARLKSATKRNSAHC